MAFLATGVIEVRGGTGADTNGGGWDTTGTGTDFSQQAAAQYAVTDAVTAGTTTVTSATANFGTDTPGNYLYIQGGSGALAVTRRRVVSRTNATTIVVDATIAASAGVTLKIGGAFATLLAAESVKVAGNAIHVKSATYAETLTLLTSGSAGLTCRWFGYDAVRGDVPLGTGRPLIDGGGVRANCVVVGNKAANEFNYFRMSGATGANVSITSGQCSWKECKSSAAGAQGWLVTSGALVLSSCEAASNGAEGVDTSGAANMNLRGCYIHDNATFGVEFGTGNCAAIKNVIEANASHGIQHSPTLNLVIDQNTVSGNTGASTDGLRMAAGAVSLEMITSNIFSFNGRYGVSRNAATVNPFEFDYNDVHGNGTAPYLNVTAGPHDTTVDPQFVDAANGNFAIPAGLLPGTPGLFPGGLSTGYTSMGAVQPQAAASGGGATVENLWS